MLCEICAVKGTAPCRGANVELGILNKCACVSYVGACVEGRVLRCARLCAWKFVRYKLRDIEGVFLAE